MIHQTHLSIPAFALRPAPSPGYPLPPRTPHAGLHPAVRLKLHLSPNAADCGRWCCARLEGSPAFLVALAAVVLLLLVDPLPPGSTSGWRTPAARNPSAGECSIAAAATPTAPSARRPMILSAVSARLWYVLVLADEK